MVFSSKIISENTWIIHGEGCTSYLLIGEEEAIAIDTGFATDNIRDYMQTLTDKPVTKCFNTHGHFDQTGGNGFFERAYMTAEALKTAIVPYASLADKNYPLQYPITIISEGEQIDLGNRCLEVIEIPAHSPSSVAFLDIDNRMLFSGDEIGHVTLIWLMMDGGQPYVEDYVYNMEKLKKREKDFDIILTTRGDKAYDKTLLENCLNNGKKILEGYMGEKMELTGNEAVDFYLPEQEFKRRAIWKDTSICFDSRYVKRDK